MKILFIIGLVSISILSKCQSDTILQRIYLEEVVTSFNKKNTPIELKSACNRIWKIEKSIWFKRRWKGGYSRRIGGNNSCKVFLAYQTNNHFVIFYRRISGRAIVPHILILDSNYGLLFDQQPKEIPKSNSELQKILKDNAFYSN